MSYIKLKVKMGKKKLENSYKGMKLICLISDDRALSGGL